MMFRRGCSICFFLLPLCGIGNDFVFELNRRYAPYADWEEQLELEELSGVPTDSWWRTPREVRESRGGADLPLSGVHLALDPGHIGGAWASIEGRDFKISPEDYPVREGELVLEVARLVRAELLKMGARVTLLRNKAAPLNRKPPEAYFPEAAKRVDLPADISVASFLEYGLSLRRVMERMHAVPEELAERARLVNEEIKPDALISLHINAAPWPLDKTSEPQTQLVDSNHTHVLIFGCLSEAELSVPSQRRQMIVKLTNGSGAIERELGQAFGLALGHGTSLPASNYNGKNAVRLEGYTPYLWSRNLMLLRYVQCPVILLEPYIANSKATYPRIQSALQARQAGAPLPEDDILVEYANAVVAGALAAYGPDGGWLE